MLCFEQCLAQLSLTIRCPAIQQPWASVCGLQVCGVPQTVNLDTSATQLRGVHTASPLLIFRNTEFEERPDFGVKMESKKWNRYNTVVYPPTEQDESIRPAEVCHSRFNMKYSPKKMWYIAVMIRGMSVDEAMKQLSFYRRKGAKQVFEVLEEAQEIAVRDHNVEFKSNLWICDSFVGKGRVVKGIRKHMGPRYGIVHYRYVHYFVRLREGKPPKHYYPPPPTGHDKMEEYIREQRQRRIISSL
ncbi:large ribosomal subunit protein uL22m-like isoform X2 [Littorina saxatilis]|uniref:large ribosomal subunit protein uL22m-like isoform X2 n=1 Tax=Littorina saxatilis TaxID=31220 RepID=UPI0038B5D361